MDSKLLRVDLPSTSLSVKDASGNLQDADVASTCPLLTPSPPTNALVNPCDPECGATSPVMDGDELAHKLGIVSQGGSAHSSNLSVAAEPASAQLLHTYLTCTKSGGDGIALQENGVHNGNLDVPYARKVESMSFFKWNWPVIRKCFIWGSLSSIMGAFVLVIAMVATLPKTCNPQMSWYQGQLFYEIFPASFHDSNSDGMGDIKGLVMKADYIKSLGVSGIRLNSIFPSPHYPEDYQNVTTLFNIQYNLGSMDDFRNLTKIFHAKGLAVVLDLPVWPLITADLPKIVKNGSGEVETTTIDYGSTTEEDAELVESENTITEALTFWLDKGVDGFYLKGIEKFIHDPYLPQSIREWKLLLGGHKILMVSYEVFKLAPSYMMEILLNRIDLVDIRLNIENGAHGIKEQIEQVQQGILWSKPGAPWVQWSAGSIDSHRLSRRLASPNATLGLTLIQMLLPGTPNIFYGDEIALGEVIDPNGDRADLKHLHQLTTMIWEKNENEILHKSHLPWLPGKPEYFNFDFKEIIGAMSRLRNSNPSIYVNGVFKDSVVTCNAAVRYSDNNILVIERWFPRRNTFVIVSNLANKSQSVDLSSLYYSGTVMVASNPEIENDRINFNFIRLKSGDAIVLKLDK